MKRMVILALGLGGAVMAQSQNVGIGTAAPNASAQLDVSSADKGLLLPRMNTAAISAISNPAKGLLVYDTATNKLMVNMGNAAAPDWQTIVSKSGWGLTGNSGLNPAADFIGTTDSIPFVIKAFNQKAGRVEPSEFGSTFFGFKAGNANVSLPSHNGNTAVGSLALLSNTNGTQNVAVGNRALGNNNPGSRNVANGYGALFSNVSGERNVGVGFFALDENATGNNNVAVGEWAMKGNRTGHANVAVGARALYAGANRSNLVAVGDSALFYNGLSSPQAWEAMANTAVGSKALFYNLSGSYLTATGYRSLYSNVSGTVNAAYGGLSMEANTAGNANAAFGYRSLQGNTEGSSNTAVGTYSLIANETGSYNTGIGHYALQFNNASQYNTAVGSNAANSYYLGWNNTLIGADADVSFNGQYNSIAIGNLAASTDNSKVRLGNSANWSYEAFANWTNISDGRFKTNIRENVAGLNFILKLRPVTYNINVSALSSKFGEDRSQENNAYMAKAMAEKERMLWTGFVAQEVEEAAKQTGFNFSGVDKPRNEHGVYGLRYAEFVVPLVKAVQEQQAMMEEMKKEIALLKEQNKLLMQAAKR